MGITGVLAAVALVGGFAQTDASTAPPIQDASAKPEKICKRIVPTGSILPIKICLTNPEWKEFTAKTNSGAEQFLDRRQTRFCRDPGQC